MPTTFRHSTEVDDAPSGAPVVPKTSGWQPQSGQTSISVAALSMLAVVLGAGLVLRVLFLNELSVPAFDPWRHLQLLKNLESGIGFTLFDGQSYFWYSPSWYFFAAFLGAVIAPDALSAVLSIAAVGFFYCLLLRTEGSVVAATTGGLLMAAFAPQIAFTASYGAESFAVMLMLVALLCCALHSKPVVVFFGGMLFGLALVNRMNLAFNLLLFLPLIKTRTKLIVFGAGFSLPMVMTWWRNYQIISRHEFLFSWDGLATSSADYSLLAILVPQIHPAVGEATRTLYETIAPVPQWLLFAGSTNWSMVVFLLVAVICLVATRRPWLIAVGLGTLLYFNAFDRTMSTHFFRHYLAVFPVLFWGVAIVVDRAWRAERWNRMILRSLAVTVVTVILICGAKYLKPVQAFPIEMSLCPVGLLTEQRYMVNSGFYHPEALIYQYENIRFIGLPLDPEHFDRFVEIHGADTPILWHVENSVQDELFDYLIETGRYAIPLSAVNQHGMHYLVLNPIGNRRMLPAKDSDPEWKIRWDGLPRPIDELVVKSVGY